MSDTKTVYISIGNSDDKLTQAEWAAFAASVRGAIRAAVKHALAMLHRRDEYGVIQDRSSQGLGKRLIRQHASRDRAETDAEVLRRVEPFPVEVKHRAVFSSDWRDLPAGGSDGV